MSKFTVALVALALPLTAVAAPERMLLSRNRMLLDFLKGGG